MILLDTTVLVYAVGEEHPLKEPCRRILSLHATGQIELATTIEVIQEFAHVYARRRRPPEAVNIALQWVTGLDVIATTREDLLHGLVLFEERAALSAFDAILAAVALRHPEKSLISADRAFSAIRGLKWRSPTTFRE